MEMRLASLPDSAARLTSHNRQRRNLLPLPKGTCDSSCSHLSWLGPEGDVPSKARGVCALIAKRSRTIRDTEVPRRGEFVGRSSGGEDQKIRRASSTAQCPPLHGLDQRAGIDRLGEMLLVFGQDGALGVLRTRICSEGDGGHMRRKISCSRPLELERPAATRAYGHPAEIQATTRSRSALVGFGFVWLESSMGNCCA